MVIAVDFDGTIVEHKYPRIGKEIPFAIDTLKRLGDEGHKLILWSVRESLKVDFWVEETISGTKGYSQRRLGQLFKKVRKDEVLICSELSRFGCSLFMIMEILNICMTKECRVWTVKENYRLGGDLQSKVLAFAFSLSAEIARQLNVGRTTLYLYLRYYGM